MIDKNLTNEIIKTLQAVEDKEWFMPDNAGVPMDQVKKKQAEWTKRNFSEPEPMTAVFVDDVPVAIIMSDGNVIYGRNGDTWNQGN